MSDKYVCPFLFQPITASSLISSQEYQRELSGSHVNELVRNFNKYLAHPILASKRDGNYYVYDGQHTLAMFIKLFGPNVVVPVLVVDGLTEAEEAKLFRHQSDFTKKLTVKNQLNAGFVANEADVADYCNILSDCGYSFDFSKEKEQNKDGMIASHAYTFNQIFRKKGKGAEQLKVVLNLIATVWGRQKDALDVEVLKGIDVFTTVYKGEYNKERLIASLQVVGPKAIKIKSTESSAKGSNRYAHAVLMIYNNNLKSEKKLPNKLL